MWREAGEDTFCLYTFRTVEAASQPAGRPSSGQADNYQQSSVDRLSIRNIAVGHMWRKLLTLSAVW